MASLNIENVFKFCILVCGINCAASECKMMAEMATYSTANTAQKESILSIVDTILYKGCTLVKVISQDAVS